MNRPSRPFSRRRFVCLAGRRGRAVCHSRHGAGGRVAEQPHRRGADCLWPTNQGLQPEALRPGVRLPGRGRLRGRPLAAGARQEGGRGVLCQAGAVGHVQGLLGLPRLPRAAGPQGHRRGDDLHARPLARADVAGRHRGRQGRVAARSRSPAAIAEGRAVADAGVEARAASSAPTASSARSANFIRAVELVRNGGIGKLHTIRTGVPAGDNVDCPATPDMPVPEDSTTSCGKARRRGPPTPRTASTRPRVTTGRAGCASSTTATA